MTVRASIEPMYATIGVAIPESDRWAFEPKYDGIRVLAFATSRAVRLMTRNGKDKAKQFPEVVDALRSLAMRLDRPVVLDGEIVAMVDGRPARFQQLQSRMHVKEASTIAEHSESTPSALIAFDVLQDGDETLIRQPWHERRAVLERLLAGRLPRELRLGESELGGGRALLDLARRDGWEGIIAKQIDAPYEPGARSRAWLKLKIEFRQEFVIGGYTEPRNSRQYLGAVLLGYFDGDRFVYVGHTGGGFNRDSLAEMHARLTKLERASSPFTETPKTNERAHWVTPKVVVEVKFSEWTTDAKLRQPIFLGVRDDKPAREVGLEGMSVQTSRGQGSGISDPKKTATRVGAKSVRKSATKSRAKRASSATGRSIVAQLESIEREGGDGVVSFDDGRTLSVSSLDKMFFPKARLTKGDLMRYYARVAPALLPAIADRPLSLKRYPNGAAGPSFFQQNAGDNSPAGVRIEKLAVLDQGKQPRIVGGDLLTLLYTVQIGSIAVNPWHSRVGSLDSPDYAVLDLDPGPRVTWARIVDVAKLVRAELRELDLECALKTSGSRGIHLLIPLPPRTSYAASARIAELVATRVAESNPKIATVERALGKRPAGTVYVDHMQNARGKTLASVFSVRAKPDATVSAPLGARQLGSVAGVGAFTIATVSGKFGRLATLWTGAMESGNDAAAVRAAAKIRD